MHLKNFPKRLDSKTSCLRITVPENLDLALEGLIRKVLKEQPKTDYIHSFAADYFETLVKIRDKAGAKYSSAQLCPFHNDEDAHEMIKLASTFSKPLKKNGKEPPPSSGKVVESEKGTKSRVGSRGTDRPKAKERLKKEGKQNGSSKQVAPDLIRKLVVEGEEENDEEESKTGVPIKELVEKEFKMEALAQKGETDSKETPKASAQEETLRGQPEEEANIGEGVKEGGEIREEGTEDLVNGNDGRSEATEVANEERRDGAEETTDAKEAGLVLGREIPVKISAAETVADVKKDGAKLSAEQTEAEKMETKTPTGAEVANAEIVEDKLPTAEKNRELEMTDEINASDVLLPDAVGVEMRNGENGGETVPKEAEGEENESEKSLRELMAGNDGTGPRLEADMQPLKEKSHSISEESAAECLVAEVQERSDVKGKTERISGEDVTNDAGKADTVVAAGTMKTTSPLLKDTDEHKVNAENADQQRERPEPGVDSESGRKMPESEEKPPTEEESLEGSSEKNERAEPEKAEKSKTEEEVTSDGGIASKENVTVASVEDVAPAEEEVPGEQKKVSPIKTEEGSKASILDQPKEHERGEGSKGDATAEEKLLEEQRDDETAVRVEAGEDEAGKSGAKAQPLSRAGDDLERVDAEAISPSVNGTAEAERVEETVDVKEAEPEPDLKESENEEGGDELCTVVDIRQVPPKGDEIGQKKDAKEPEEELCTVVDSQHIIRIEEPEEANDSVGMPQPPEEVQIKTIQTHYYDALQVPETVTKELRVHNVSDVLSVAPLLADPVKAESNGNVEIEDANAAHPAGFSDSAQIDDSSSAETGAESAPQQRADSAVEVPLLMEAPTHHELGSDTRRSETDDLLDLMTPTSGYSISVSDLSWRTVSGMFLESERRHSSQLSDELRCGTPKSDENISRPEEGPESGERRPEIEEVFHERVLPTLVGAVPMPSRDAEEIEKEKGAGIPEDAQEMREKKPGDEPFGGSSDDKSFDSDSPFISVEVKTVIETQVLDDDDEGERRPRLELKVEATVEVEDAEEETRKESESSPEGEEKEMSDGEQKGGEGGPKAADSSAGDGDGDGSGEQTAAREGSSGESDSTISSAATEIKRSDPEKRGVGGEGSLLLSQSLDLGGRNPLLRTRSLSTFRHGVTDFEVWNAIEKELEEAATKIQARFRSYKARKKLQRGNAVQMTTEESSTSTTPAEPEERQQSTGEFHDSIVLSDHPR